MLNEGENMNNVKNAFLLQTNMMLSFLYASFPSNTVHNARFACCFYRVLINLNQKKLYILNTRYYRGILFFILLIFRTFLYRF